MEPPTPKNKQSDLYEPEINGMEQYPEPVSWQPIDCVAEAHTMTARSWTMLSCNSIILCPIYICLRKKASEQVDSVAVYDLSERWGAVRNKFSDGLMNV